MKKQEIKGLDLTYYRETLENGLDVVLIPMEDKKNYFITYATRFGSDITTFTPHDEEEQTVPAGVAHFLEHKMFEQPDGEDPFTFFSKSGTGSNASTSFDHTQYICYGTKNFKENLRYLIRFVNTPYYTDENVEKEKGIIVQELKMYNDMPDYALEMKLRENVFHNSPRKVDIGGTEKSVNETTKEDLYKCYNNFYSPNNMFIVIAGNFNHKDALKIIVEELDLKENVEYPKVKVVEEKESVVKKEEKITAAIQVPKLAVALKIKRNILGDEDYIEGMYLNMLTRILFGATSDFNQKCIEENLSNGIYRQWEILDGYRVYYIMADTEKMDKLLEEIKKVFKELKVDEASFNRGKKVWIANYVRDTDNVEAVTYSFFDDMLYNKEIIDNRLDTIRNMSFERLKEYIDKIDFTNISIVTMKPNKK